MEFTTEVFYEQDGKFAGWPANHGIWLTDSGPMVGFDVCDRKSYSGGYHDIDVRKPATVITKCDDKLYKLPGFEGLPPYIESEAPPLKTIPFNLEITDQPIKIRFNHFWVFEGEWKGPFLLDIDPGAGHAWTSRTCYQETPFGHDLYLSRYKEGYWGSDYVSSYFTDDFKSFTHIRDITLGDNRTVMPSVGYGIVACRAKGGGKNWIQTFAVGEPVYNRVSTGSNNGNPPALVMHKKEIYLIYGYRSRPFSIRIRKLNPDGWGKHEYVYRSDQKCDIGYPVACSYNGDLHIYFYKDGIIYKSIGRN